MDLAMSAGDKASEREDRGMLAVVAELTARKLRGETPGTRTELAELLDVSKQAISGWKKIPPRHVSRVANVLKIPVHVLRPDVFPAPLHAEAIKGRGLRAKAVVRRLPSRGRRGTTAR